MSKAKGGSSGKGKKVKEVKQYRSIYAIHLQHIVKRMNLCSYRLDLLKIPQAQ